MSSGRDILGEIDRALTKSRQDFRALDVELQATSAELGRLGHQEAGIYRQLAAKRLAELKDQTFVDALDQADRAASERLKERDTALAQLQQRIAASEAALESLTEQREQKLAAVEAAELALEECLAGVDQQLATDARYLELVRDAQQALDTAAAAEAKAAEAEARRDEKKQPFEADPLFLYLWQRGYGTEAYRANLFARMMDRRVAQHIRYERARQNYYLLNEIPKRLAQHTERLEQHAAEAAIELADYERAADVEAGAEALEQSLNDAREALKRTDTEIAANEDVYSERVAEREAFASGSDPLLREAMSILANQFSREPIPELRRAAALSPGADDDHAVEALETLRDRQQRLRHYLDDRKGLHQQHAQRVNELSGIRGRYTQRQYDAYNSRIDDRGAISQLIGEFLRGLVSSDQLWSGIRRAQRFERSRQRVSGVRHRVGNVRIPRMPRGVRFPGGGGGGSRGGGGFRTKGGF